MTKLRTLILATALTLAAGTATAWAAVAPEARSINAIAVANQVLLDSTGQRHDPARFARLLALVESPQLTVLNVERWAEARRGGGAGGVPLLGDQPMAQPMPLQPYAQPRTQSAPAGSAMAPISAMPGFMVTPAANVIGEDKAARAAFKRALIANRAYILDMRNRLLGTRSLRDADVAIDTVIGVDVLPGSGGLEVFTVPVR